MRRVASFLSVALAGTMLTLSAPAPGLAREMPGSFADLVETLSPAVVNISTTQKVKGGVGPMGIPLDQLPDTPEMDQFRDFMERFGGLGQDKDGGAEREVTSLGSGFIVEAAGYIITNYHVIDQASDIKVTLSDKTQYTAKVIGRDNKTELALLTGEAKKPLPFVSLGDSDAARVGDWVIAIGNPFGLGGSVTAGIISARQRSIHAGPFDDFLQTDASINRGNSGGPLFDMSGRVVGINSAIFSPSGGNIGIGFAIPAAIARPVIEQLKTYGRTHRGWLGVKIQEVSEEVAESVGLPAPTGALVLEVTPGGPAAKIGIKEGDIITQYNGRDITEMRFLPRMVAETKIDSQATVTVWRKGKAQTYPITIGELKEDDDNKGEEGSGKKGETRGSDAKSMLGMRLNTLTPELRREYRVEEKTQGIAVVAVEENSEADKRGFAEGDIITEVNGTPVRTYDELKAAIDGAKKAGRKFALLKVVRNKDSAFITLPTSEAKKE